MVSRCGSQSTHLFKVIAVLTQPPVVHIEQEGPRLGCVKTSWIFAGSSFFLSKPHFGTCASSVASVSVGALARSDGKCLRAF